MARVFNGTTQKLEATNPITGFPFSISGWIYAPDVTNDFVLWSMYQPAASNYIYGGCAGSVGGDPANTDFYPNSGSGRAATSTGYSANTWHNVISVCSASNSWATYIDGGSKGTTSATYTGTFASMTKLAVAYLFAFSTNIYDAIRAADVTIWNVALTDAEAAAIGSGLRTGSQVRPDKIVAYYPLGGLYGDTDDDRWSGAHDFTAYNSPTWADHPRLWYPDDGQVVTTASAAASYPHRLLPLLGVG